MIAWIFSVTCYCTLDFMWFSLFQDFTREAWDRWIFCGVFKSSTRQLGTVLGRSAASACKYLELLYCSNVS